MNDYITVNGMAGKAKLSEATNTNMRSVERWLSGHTVPSAQKRYRLARQCGCTHEEALELANEGSSEAKRAG